MRWTALAWTALVAVALASRAEEPNRQPSRLPELSRSFPTPSDRHAFRFVSRVLLDGTTQSLLVFEAEVAQEQGDTVWRVSDRMLTPDGREMRRWTAATLDARLRPLHGRLGGVGMGSIEGMELRWRRVGDEVRMEGGPIGEPSEARHARVLTHEGPLVFNHATAILLARLAPTHAEPLHLALARPELGFPQGDAILDAEWRLDGSAEYEGKPAATIEVGTEGRRTRIVLTRDLAQFLAMDPGHGGGQVRILPLRTLEQAAEEMRIALETGDARLLHDVVHWPSVAETVDVTLPSHVPEGTTPPMEVARRAVLERFRERFPVREESAKPHPAGVQGDAIVMRDDDGVGEATLKTSRGSFTVGLAKRQGNGYVVRLPEILTARDAAR